VPFKSKQQMKFMFSQMPKTARRWADEQKASSGKGSFKKLPKRAKGSKATPSKTKAAQKKQTRKRKTTKKRK